MASQITVSGRIQHKHMDTTLLMKRVEECFPKLERSDADFVIPLADCRAEFFCTSSQSLDFRIAPSESDGAGRVTSSKAVTAIEMLVRSTDTLWVGMRRALKVRRLRRYPVLDRCVIEDTQSRSILLVRDSLSPLRSPGAKVAYIISFLFCIIGLALILWQLSRRQPADSRIANVITIAVSLGIAALSTPLPIVINWRDWKRTFAWRYVRLEQR
jgi:hypothetical protein